MRTDHTDGVDRVGRLDGEDFGRRGEQDSHPPGTIVDMCCRHHRRTMNPEDAHDLIEQRRVKGP